MIHALDWLAIIGLVTSSFSALGLYCLKLYSRHDLEMRCRKMGKRELFHAIMRHDDDVEIGLTFFRVFASALVVTACMARLLEARPDLTASWSVVLASATLGALILWAFEVWFPWAIARLWSESLLYAIWPVWSGISRFMALPVYASKFIDTLFHRLAGRQPEKLSEDILEDEIRTIVTEGHHEGLLEDDAREMIEGIMELGDADVSEIMTPRTQMVSFCVDMPWDEVVQFVIKSRHTRIPVYAQTRDDIVGILYAKDLLPELAKGADQERSELKGILREPQFVPETKPVDDLLEEFQKTRNHMAIVLDEYGGVSGIVTIEDVLEEIVGEIIDEYDAELEESIEKVDERTCDVLAHMHVDEVNQQLGLNLPEDGDFDTIGGFLFTELGRIPEVGEQLELHSVRFTVLEASPRTILKVRIEQLSEPHRESA